MMPRVITYVRRPLCDLLRLRTVLPRHQCRFIDTSTGGSPKTSFATTTEDFGSQYIEDIPCDINSENLNQVLDKIISRKHSQSNARVPKKVWNSIITQLFRSVPESLDDDECFNSISRVLEYSISDGHRLQSAHFKELGIVIEDLMKLPNGSGIPYCCNFIDVISTYVPSNRPRIFFNLLANQFRELFFKEETKGVYSELIKRIKDRQLAMIITSFKETVPSDNYIRFLDLLVKNNPDLNIKPIVNSIIQQMSWSKDVTGIEKLLSHTINYTDSRYHPDEDALILALNFYSSLGDGPKALKLLEDFEARGLIKNSEKKKEIYTLVAITYNTDKNTAMHIKRGIRFAFNMMAKKVDNLLLCELLRAITYSKDYSNIKKYFISLRNNKIKIDDMIYDNCMIRANEFGDEELAIMVLDDLLDRRVCLSYYTVASAIDCLSKNPTKLVHYFDRLANSNLVSSPLVVVSYLQSLLVNTDTIPDVYKHAKDTVDWAFKKQLCSTDLVNALLRIFHTLNQTGEVKRIYYEYFVRRNMEINTATINILGIIDSTATKSSEKAEGAETLSLLAYKQGFQI